MPLSESPTLWCDNHGATYLATNPVFHAYKAHNDFNFVRDMVAHKQIKLQFISTNDNVADVLTKPFSTTKFVQPFQAQSASKNPFRLQGDIR